MARTILVFFERLLITAVSILIGVIVVSLLIRALRGPDVVVSTVGTDGEIVAADGDGTTTEFVPVTFPEGPCVEERPEVGEGVIVLPVYYTCGNNVLPTGDAFVFRRVPGSEDLLEATLRELLQGPSTREAALGFRSVFSVTTAGALESTIVEGAEAVIDFSELPSVSGLAAANEVDFFIANLNANVFQFPEIRSVEYRLDGSCAAFWDHLGDDTGCRILARENHEATMERNRAE